MTKFNNFKTTGASGIEKLESLAQAVQQAVSSLRGVQADIVLDTDFSLVSCLAVKLPATHTEKWYDAVAREGGGVTWAKFMRWLNNAGAAAKVARNAELKVQLGKGNVGLGAAAVTVVMLLAGEVSKEGPKL